ncbi:MAG: hypothetical protein ABIP55_17105 [Tepidisphaeraceae bacterium]
MPRQSVSLDVIDVAKPCPADWNAMRGDDRVRFCKHCSLHVYNLSAMTRSAAENLVAEREGRLCVQFYRRLDGTVLTADCEGGWKLAAKRFGRWAKTATAVVLTAALAPLGLTRWGTAAPTEPGDGVTTVQPADVPATLQLLGKMRPPAQQRLVRGEAVVPIMGDIAIPVPPPPPQPNPPQPTPPPATQPQTTQPAR